MRAFLFGRARQWFHKCHWQVECSRLSSRCVGGSVRPLLRIDRTFTLDEAPQALAHVGTGRALGKVVVSVSDSGQRA